jgi:hypothetical protein
VLACIGEGLHQVGLRGDLAANFRLLFRILLCGSLRGLMTEVGLEQLNNCMGCFGFIQRDFGKTVLQAR